MTTSEIRPSTPLLHQARSCAPVDSAESAPLTLSEAVHAAVRSVSAKPWCPTARSGTLLTESPQSLLAVLAYCYARGLYGSRAIEEALWRDNSWREMSGREIPQARALCRFRRDHREAVCHCLKAALAFLVGHAGSDPACDGISKAGLTEETNSRLAKAMFIDSIELEDGEL